MHICPQEIALIGTLLMLASVQWATLKSRVARWRTK